MTQLNNTPNDSAEATPVASRLPRWTQRIVAFLARNWRKRLGAAIVLYWFYASVCNPADSLPWAPGVLLGLLATAMMWIVFVRDGAVRIPWIDTRKLHPLFRTIAMFLFATLNAIVLVTATESMLPKIRYNDWGESFGERSVVLLVTVAIGFVFFGVTTLAVKRKNKSPYYVIVTSMLTWHCAILALAMAARLRYNFF